MSEQPPHRQSLRSIPTALIQLSPDFLAQLKKVAPQKKRSKLFYLALFILPAAITFAIVHRPTRTFILEHVGGKPVVATPSSAPAIAIADSVPVANATPVENALPVPSAAPVPSASIVSSVSASASASASVKPPSKPWVKRRK